MKNRYLLLTIVGTILPNIFVLKESMATGNILLYAHPLDTFTAMFATNVSSAFITDLLFIVVLFLFWTYSQAKEWKMKNIGWVWAYTFLLGIAGGLPLFLHLRERYMEASGKSGATC